LRRSRGVLVRSSSSGWRASKRERTFFSFSLTDAEFDADARATTIGALRAPALEPEAAGAASLEEARSVEVECIVVGKGKKAAFLRGERERESEEEEESEKKQERRVAAWLGAWSLERGSLLFFPSKGTPPCFFFVFLSLSLDPPFSFFSIPKRVAVTEQKTEKEKNFSL
jgi:hypothetical protein